MAELTAWADALLEGLPNRRGLERSLQAYGLARRGDPAASLALAGEVDEANPDNWTVRWHLARVYAAAGRKERALSALEEWS